MQWLLNLLAVFRIQLNGYQLKIARFDTEGLNLLIMGKAGVGKTEVVKHIIATVNARGRNVSIVCSTGIARQVYDHGIALTVHSFYGLMTADLLWHQVIKKSDQPHVSSI